MMWGMLRTCGTVLAVAGTVSFAGLISGAVASPLAGAANSREEAQEAARASITSREALSHIRFLASDELEGRDTTSRGQRVAARYIASQFERYGLEPGGKDGDWYQPFALESVGIGVGSKLAWHGSAGEGSESFGPVTGSPLNSSGDGAAAGSLVFCGYGITAPEAGYDDYADVDVKGKVVLVLRYTPRQKDTEHFFNSRRGRNHAYLRTKYRNAVAHGATGMILVTEPLHHDADNFVNSWPVIGGLYDASKAEDRDGMPAVHISQKLADRLLAAGGADLDEIAEIQRQIDADLQPRSRVLESLTVELRVELERTSAATENVVAIIRGEDPRLRDEWIIIGAHFDHVGIGGAGPDRIHNGADDNASGTAGLLEVAQAFAQCRVKPRRSIVFIAFVGEEKGLLGSRYYVANPIVPIERTITMVNLDMIGRNAENEVSVIGAPESPILDELINQANRVVGMKLDRPESINGGSDHMPFMRAGVPAAFFFTGFHDDYHRPGDHTDRIVAVKLERVSRLTFSLACLLSDGAVYPERPGGGSTRPKATTPSKRPGRDGRRVY